MMTLLRPSILSRGMETADLRPPTLLSLPSYLAGNVARIGHRMLLAAVEEHGLRLPQFAVLTALSDFGPLAQHELADRLNLNRSHLVGYIDALEERGLVQRERDPDDRRRQHVALTRTGRTLARRLHDVARASQAQFLEVLSASERETLVALLRRVVDADDERRLRET
jgi:DNA-binding MarR family transcriptional regulator